MTADEKKPALDEEATGGQRDLTTPDDDFRTPGETQNGEPDPWEVGSDPGAYRDEFQADEPPTGEPDESRRGGAAARRERRRPGQRSPNRRAGRTPNRRAGRTRRGGACRTTRDGDAQPNAAETEEDVNGKPEASAAGEEAQRANRRARRRAGGTEDGRARQRRAGQRRGMALRRRPPHGNLSGNQQPGGTPLQTPRHDRKGQLPLGRKPHETQVQAAEDLQGRRRKQTANRATTSRPQSPTTLNSWISSRKPLKAAWPDCSDARKSRPSRLDGDRGGITGKRRTDTK